MCAPLSAHREAPETQQEKGILFDFPSRWAYGLDQESYLSLDSAHRWAGVEVAWGSSVIPGTAVAVIKGNGSPRSRTGNVRTRKLAGLGKKNSGSLPLWS